MSPTWGVYSGFELFEHEPLQVGKEEYKDSEKYEYRPRNFHAEPNLNQLIGQLNGIRERHPALQQLRDIRFLEVPHDGIIAYAKSDGSDIVVVVCSLDPEWTVESEVQVDWAELGIPGEQVRVVDELTGQEFVWSERNYVRLHPGQPAHILRVMTGE